MKIALILTCALLTLTGCSNLNTLSSPIRVGSYNVRLSTGDINTPNAWGTRKNDLISFIKKLDLDVMGLQEVRPEQARYLDENLTGYAKIGEHRGKDRISDEASPVYFRTNRFECIKGGTFWLSKTPDVPGSRGWGASYPRICSWALLKDRITNKSFCFANVHTDHKSALARKEGMLLVIKRIKEFAPCGTPIIFTGDHNCRENSEPAMAVSETLSNALYISKTPPKGPWRTFNAWNADINEISTTIALKHSVEERNSKKISDKGNFFGHRIDYIYVSKGIQVNNYKTHNEFRPGKNLYHSDHHPVTAELEF
jgi:endonuclease/exonuclease/phosphatase family metal-dependent hydrolase